MKTLLSASFSRPANTTATGISARRRTAFLLAGSIAALLFSPGVQAATRTFDGELNGDLNISTNWSGDIKPIAGDEAEFATITLPVLTTTDNNQNYSNLIWNSNATSSITINTGTANSAAIGLAGGSGFSQAIADGGATGDLILMGTNAVSNTLSIGGNAGTGTGRLQLTLNASGNFDVVNAGATLNVSAVIGGTNSLTKTGAGTLTLSAANTFTAFTLSAGTFNMNNAAALSSGTFTIAGGTIDNTSGAAITNSKNNVQSWTGDFAFGGTNDLNLGTGAVTLSAARTVTTTAGNLTVGGVIGGAFGLTKNGAGTLTLNNTNTFGGAGASVTLNAGTLNIGKAAALGSASNTFVINGGTIDNTTGSSLTTSNYAQTWNGDFAFTGGSGTTHDLNLGTGAVSLGTAAGTTRTITVNAGILTVGGVISSASGKGITKAGAGTLVLSGANTYGGGMTIKAGAAVAAVSNSGTTSGAFGPSTAAITLGDAGGSTNASLLSNTFTVSNPINVAATSGTLTIGGNTTASPTFSGAISLGQNVVVQSNGTATFNLTGVISGAGGLDASGATGSLLLSGVGSTYAGNLSFGGNILTLNDASALGANTGSFIFSGQKIDNTTSGTVTLTSTKTKSWNSDFTYLASRNLAFGAGAVTLGGNRIVTINLTLTGNTYTENGAIGDGGNGYSLTKAGAGSLTLNENSTYSGATTVAGGILNLVSTNSKLSNTSSVTVNGGTLNVGVAGGAVVANRINPTAPLTLGGTNGGGTLQINAGIATGNSQAFTTLSIGAGSNQLSSSSTALPGTLNFTGAGASVYSRAVGGTVRFQALAASSPFANAPTGASVAGSGTSAILIGAVSGSGANVATDFVQAAAGVIAAPTYATNTFGSGLNTDVTSSFTAAAGATQSLRFNAAQPLTLTLAGTSTIESGGILVTSNANFGGGSTITGGTLRAASGQDLWVYTSGSTGSQDLTIGSLIADNAGSSLTKSGGRKLFLTNDSNTYAGGTFLNEGTLNISSGGALGAVSGPLSFYGTATLQAGAANVDLGARAVTIVSGQTGTIDTNGGTMQSSGVISGAGTLSKGGVGTLTLTGANTYTGITNAQRGTLRLDYSAAGAPTTNIVSSASQLLLGQYTTTLVAGSDTLEIAGKDGAASSQAFANTVFGKGAGHVNLTAGTGGTLAVNLGNVTRNTLTGVLDAAAPMGATLDINIGSGVTVSGTGSTGNGILAPSGHSAVTVNGTTWAALSGSNIIAYPTASYATSAASANVNLDVSGSALALNVNNPYTLRFNSSTGDSTLGLLSGSVHDVLAGGILVTPNVGANLSIIGPGLIAGASRRDLILIQNNLASDLRIDATITDIAAGAQVNTKSGLGRVILTAANTNSGATLINEGTLVVAGDVVSGVTQNATYGNSATTITVPDVTGIFVGQTVTGGNLNINTTTTYTVVGISGTTVTLSSTTAASGAGTGPLVFSGAAGLGIGATSQHIVGPGATLQIGNGGTTGTLLSTQTIQTNGSLVLNRSDSFSFPNVVSGTGGLEKKGAGDVTLPATNSFTGDTKISAGRIVLGITGSLGGSTLDYNSYGGTLSFGILTGATLGGLKGSQNLNLVNDAATPAAVSLIVGGNGLDSTYSGNLTGIGTANALTKNGLGALTLSGTANLYTGSTLINSGTFNLTGNLGSLATPTGKLTTTGGSVTNITGNLVSNSYLGAGDGGTSTINVKAGSVTLTSSNAIFIGTSTAGGLINISGGIVKLTGSGYVGVGGGGTNGTGTNGAGVLTISGTGTLDTGTTAAVFRVGSNSAGNTTGTGTVNLDGGTLSTNRAIIGGGVGASTFNFNGGLFKATGTTATLSGINTAQVRNGGAIFDTQAFNVTMAQPLLHSTIAGDNAVDGGLSKAGTGTLTLSGANSYTGPTSVTGGTLEISGSIGGGGIDATGGTVLLSGTGTDRVGNASTLNLGTGGTLLFASTAGGGLKETMGAFSLTGDAAINLGTGTNGTTFVLSSLDLNGHILSIYNWSGSFGLASDDGTLATQDRLLFASSVLNDPAFNPNDLSTINFYSGSTTDTFVGTGAQIAFTGSGGGFEIVAVPEPTSAGLLGGVALLGLFGYRDRLRRKKSS